MTNREELEKTWVRKVVNEYYPNDEWYSVRYGSQSVSGPDKEKLIDWVEHQMSIPKERIEYLNELESRAVEEFYKNCKIDD